jgi:hypothetical protein
MEVRMAAEDLVDDAYHPNRDGSDVDRWLCSLIDMLEQCYKQFLFLWGAQSKTPALRFGLLKSGKFRAWASTQGAIDTVGINLGLVFLMRDLFDRIFSHPDIFSPNQSETNRDFYAALAVDIDLEQALHEHRPFTPNDTQRKNSADFCFQAGLLWIFTHELSHIYLGHCDFLQSKGELPRVSEDGFARSQLAGRDRQAMEDMADSLSTMFLANAVLTTDRQLSKPDQLERLFTFFFAINCVLTKFQGLGLGRPDSANATHPMPVYRSAGFVALATTIITNWTNDFTLEEVRTASIEGSTFARIAFATLLRTELVNINPNKVNEAVGTNFAVQDVLASRTATAPFRARDGISAHFDRWQSLTSEEPCPCGSGNSLERCHAPAVEFWRKFFAGPTGQMAAV